MRTFAGWATAVAASLAIAAPASALTVGSYDSSRAYSGYDLATGSQLGALRLDLVSAGHTFSATSTVDATYLSTIDVFYTSLLPTSGFAFAAGEEAALYDWIAAGGTMIYQGENDAWTSVTNLFLAEAGLTHTGLDGPATFESISHPLLANGVAGSAMGGGPGGVAGADVVLASGAAGAAAFLENYGDGAIIGFMDVNALGFYTDRRFILNAVEYTAEPVGAEVPLPAALPLLGAAVASLGFVARRRRRAA